ncbi:hypothetical protein [Chitinophaga sp. HK235]|uniref:hypothetical protein n=1 Tax=Chitinophaga sp. HK235 TaxID=2952571 RepID=UPI001BACB11B|nr:hypothetical protein [Chitinophaga sp. HK235]
MRTWETIIRATDPVTGELKTFGGPNIQAPSQQLAHEYCQANGMGYCRIGNEIVAEILARPDGSPDWNQRIDYDNNNN